MRAVCVSSFLDFDKICKKAGRHMTDEDHGRMSTAIEHVDIQCTGGRGNTAEHPSMEGLADYSKTNPRAVHCYLDEDFVGRLKRLVNSVCATGGMRTSRRAMHRYSVGVCLRWWDYTKTLRKIPVVHRKRGGGHRRGKGQQLVAQINDGESCMSLFIARIVHRDLIVASGEYKSSHRRNHHSSTTLARSPTCKLVVWSVPPGTGIVVWSVAGEPATIVDHGGQPLRCQPAASL